MKQIQPFQKHWLQITSIVVCRLKATSSDRHGVSITDQSNVCSTVCSDCQQRNIKGPRYWTFVRRSHCDQWFPTQKESNMENASIWWRHNGLKNTTTAHVSYYAIYTLHYSNGEQRDYHLAEGGRWAPKVTNGLTESFAGKTFEVFTRFKPNLVCPLGWGVDDAHQLQLKKMTHCKSHLTV